MLGVGSIVTNPNIIDSPIRPNPDCSKCGGCAGLVYGCSIGSIPPVFRKRGELCMGYDHNLNLSDADPYDCSGYELGFGELASDDYSGYDVVGGEVYLG